jgi:hypothetical protein
MKGLAPLEIVSMGVSNSMCWHGPPVVVPEPTIQERRNFLYYTIKQNETIKDLRFQISYLKSQLEQTKKDLYPISEERATRDSSTQTE